MSIEVNLNSFVRIVERIVSPWIPVSENLAKLALELFSDVSVKTVVGAIESKVSKDESNTEHFIQFAEKLHNLAIAGNTTAIAKLCHAFVEGVRKGKESML